MSEENKAFKKKIKKLSKEQIEKEAPKVVVEK